jgi:hypothetical protein
MSTPISEMEPGNLVRNDPPGSPFPEDRWYVVCPQHGVQCSPRTDRDEALGVAREHLASVAH